MPTHMSIHMFIGTSMHLSIHMSACTCIHMFIHTPMHLSVNIPTHTCLQTHICVWMQKNTIAHLFNKAVGRVVKRPLQPAMPGCVS